MVMLTDGKKEDALRIPISEAYLAGRLACREGRDVFDGIPYESLTERTDYSVGWLDERDGVPAGERAEVKQ